MADRRYYGEWKTWGEVAEAFFPEYEKTPVPETFPTDGEVVFAVYSAEGYEGWALVVYRRGGQLYEVYGSHCSCYGLEGQWEPEATTVEALGMRAAAWYGSYDPEVVVAYSRLFPRYEPT